ncbi:MAG: gliding motility-associated C-terminal domain-containing protein [Bacteroidetes bacterium]|nr:gliding motility-associated C-terminal domain-containing protein [Bacteroidota bacterium]
MENKGQWPGHVNYRSTVAGGHIWLEQYGILYQFNNYEEFHHAGLKSENSAEPKVVQDLLFAHFVGANESFSKNQTDQTTEYYNFFLGNNSTAWANRVYGYYEVEYLDLYNNIDLKFYEKEGQLKYEYLVRPGGDPADIQVQYYGEDKIKKSDNGSIVIETKLGQIIEEKPYVYQIKNGRIVEIECEFKLTKDVLSFELGRYDKSLDLIIDPVLIFATYSGSMTDNFGMTGTYDYDGNGYSGGTIYGNAYPVPFAGAYNTTSNFSYIENPNPFPVGYGITDVFISKYSADGTTMIWTNFLGGGNETDGTETVHSLICDTSNNVYLYGATSSPDFPMQNAYQAAHAGGTPGGNFLQNGVYYTNQGTDIYISKLSSDGTQLLGSTYVGGSGNDGVNYNVTAYANNYSSASWYDSLTSNYGDQFRGEIMLDSVFNVIVASSTRSTDFPVLNSFQPANAGQQDGVLFKLSNNLSSLLWSTYFGGSQNDASYSVKIDSSNNIILSGGTASSDLPNTAGALYTTYQGGKADGYVAKITPDGSTIIRTTYFGTSLYDQTYFVEIDRWDNIYVYGQTSGNIPIINAAYSNPNSGQFIAKLNPNLSSIIYSTRIGNGDGNPDISPSAFLVDVCSNVYISGWGANILIPGSPLNGMPTSPDALQPTNGDGFNFYLFVLERDAQSMLYGSYLGGGTSHEHVDGGTSRFDKYGIIYQSVCGGCWGNSDFPTTPGAWSSQNLDGNGCNNLLFKFNFEIVPIADFQISQLEGCAPLTLDLNNESNDTVNSIWSFPPEAVILSGGANPQILFTDPGTYNIYLSITDTICNLTDTAVKVVTVYEALQLSIPDDTIICASGAFDLTANSYGTATGFIWDDDPDFSSPLATGMDSVISVSPAVETTYYITATNGWPLCDIVDSVQVLFVDGAVQVMDDTTICPGSDAFLHAENLVPSVNMTFDWSPNSALISESGNTAVAGPDSTMYFYVTATTDLGCSFTDSVLVTILNFDPSLIYATATPDTVPEGGTSLLEAFPVGGYTYLWSPTGGLSNPTGQSTAAVGIEGTTTYDVTVSKGSCSAKTSVTVVTYEFVCGDVYIYVPNAFSPNGDFVNDVMFVRGLNLEEIDFKIFDRWGELVFETTDQSVGWDGTFKGEKLDPDVYVYHLRVTCFDGQENLVKGNITLMR